MYGVGERTVYMCPVGNDVGCKAPLLESQRAPADGVTAPTLPGIDGDAYDHCPSGHQGRFRHLLLPCSTRDRLHSSS